MLYTEVLATAHHNLPFTLMLVYLLSVSWWEFCAPKLAMLAELDARRYFCHLHSPVLIVSKWLRISTNIFVTHSAMKYDLLVAPV